MSTQKVRYLIEAVNNTAQPFKEVEGQLKTLNKARLEANTLVFAEQRAQQFLLSTYRQKYSAVTDTLGLMRSVGSIGSQIIGIVNSENISQMRLRDTLLDVDDAQRRVNTAQDLFGTDSVQYMAAWDDLTDAQNRYKDASNSADWQSLGVATSIIGLIGSVGTLIVRLGELYALYGVVAAALTAPLAVGTTIVGGLSYLATQGDEPNFNELMPEGMEGVTNEEMMSGVDYVDKYATWREGQTGGAPDAAWGGSEGKTINITVNAQTNATAEQIAAASIDAHEAYMRSRR